MDTLKSVLRGIYMGFGALVVFAGLFFTLQGMGIIMWPADSFMLANRIWILYGLMYAAFGAGLIWVLRRSRG
jgi:hypothetical protein